jgi:hypothetical protein
MNNNPTVCIPNHTNLNKKNLSDIFNKFGYVKNIQIYDTKAFIYFKHWYNTPNSRQILQRFSDGGHINIVYDFPWFWKCYEKRSGTLRAITCL